MALSLWRNLWLLGIGTLHTLLWDGDILVVYALASPFVLLLRNRRPPMLLAAGVATFAITVAAGLAAAATVSADGVELGEFWSNSPEVGVSDPVGLWFVIEFGGRALGMMLIGVALFRLGILNCTRAPEADRRMVKWGFGIGVPLATIAVAAVTINGFEPQWFLPSHALNTVATIPMVMGYIGVVSLWNRRADTALHERIRAVGRMALTNYLTQTLLGVLVLASLVGADKMTRSLGVVFVLAVWALQLAWSKPWLDRFRFGPFEWVWRVLTYRRMQPIRR